MNLVQLQSILINNLGQSHEIYYFNDGFIGF